MSKSLENFKNFSQPIIEDEEKKKLLEEEQKVSEISKIKENKSEAIDAIKERITQRSGFGIEKKDNEEVRKRTKESIKQTGRAIKEKITETPAIKVALQKGGGKEIFKDDVATLKETKENIKNISEKLKDNEIEIKSLKEKLQSEIEDGYKTLKEKIPDYEYVVAEATNIIQESGRYTRLEEKVFKLENAIKAVAIFQKKEYIYEEGKSNLVETSTTEEPYGIADHLVKGNRSGSYPEFRDSTLIVELNEIKKSLDELDKKGDIDQENIKSLKAKFLEGKDSLRERKEKLEKERYNKYRVDYNKLYDRQTFLEKIKYQLESGFPDYEIKNMESRGMIIPKEFNWLLKEMSSEIYPLKSEDFYRDDTYQAQTFEKVIHNMKQAIERKREENKLTKKQEEVFNTVTILQNVKKLLEELK